VLTDINLSTAPGCKLQGDVGEYTSAYDVWVGAEVAEQLYGRVAHRVEPAE